MPKRRQIQSIRNLWVSGYRFFELNIFQQNDAKLKVIADLLEQVLLDYCERGLEWILVGGQLGIDQLAVQVAKRPSFAEYNLQVAIILPFANMDKNWNEKNQAQLQAALALADYQLTLSELDYTSPQQFSNWQNFMLQHTDGSLLVYDAEYPGKIQYEYKAMQNYQMQHEYDIRLLNFYDLQDFLDSQTEF